MISFTSVETSRPILGIQPDRVVILESDLSIRKLLRRLLERRGYLAVEISRPQELCPIFRDRRADLLVVDVSAGEVNSECVVSLANAHPDLKILALSAEPFKGTMPGRLLVLPKPFPLEDFVDCVTRLLQ